MAKKNVKLVEQQEETTTENLTEDVDTTSLVTDEIVEVEWEMLENVFTFKEKLEGLEKYFGEMCLQFEKNKTNVLTQIMYGQHDIYNMAQEIQKTLNIDENLTYELKLPNTAGEKGFFVRKD
tara:strand:+ start:447 stop:812 length:366 start_codon:yes stop_codon:yes gene_type:complete